MESYNNYEEYDDMENPDQFTESQRTSSSDDEIIDVENVPEERLWHLPQSRIKAIMKLDPDMNLVSTDSVFTMTKVTELFIQSLARESFAFIAHTKMKTLQKKHVDCAINSVDALMFLEGALDFN